MKAQSLFGLIFLATISVSAVFSQDCKEIQKLIDETYNFKPAKISEAERSAKSERMDAVWNKVKSNPRTFLPCLRDEIDARTDDAFFRFDASNLLIGLDRSDESKKRLIRSYAEVDLDDVNMAYWMRYIAVLGYENFDTSQAGENWLKHPNPKYYLPEHGSLAVNKETGALIIYGSMDESIATPALAKIASQENNPARNLAVDLLLQQTTSQSFTELKKLNAEKFSVPVKQKINDALSGKVYIAPREGTPKVSRLQYLEAFDQLTKGKPQTFIRLTIDVPDGEKDAVAVLKQEDIPLVRKARRFFAASATPHSAEWYKSFTNILMTMVRNSESNIKVVPPK